MKSMFRFSMTAAATTALILTTLGCQPSSLKGSEDASSSSINHSNCVASKPVDVDALEIQGAAGVEPGQLAHYKLNEDMGCSPSQSVTWTDASGKATGSGATHESTFNKLGVYVVTAQIQSADSLVPSQVSYKTVVTQGLAVNGPQVGMAEVDNTFSLVVPAGATVASASWDFGDGSPLQSGLGPIDYAYINAGMHTVNVTVNFASGDSSLVSHSIQILPAIDGLTCVNQLAISGPTTSIAGDPVSLTVFLPPCVQFGARAVTWDFGDNTAPANAQSVTHIYETEGTYRAAVSIFIGESSTPLVTLYQDLTILPATPGVEDPPPVDPPVILDECTILGMQRQISGEIFNETVACGVSGHRTNSYRNTVLQVCSKSGDLQKWLDVGTTKDLTKEGPCEGQACEVPASALNGLEGTALGLQLINGKYYLNDGASKLFYTTTRPEGACSEVSTVRSCSNGVLGGSSTSANLTCENGCPGFGAAGTVKTGVVTGSENVAHTCAYGETGIFDQFTQVSDQTCKAGQVVNSNSHRGTIKSEGVCPTYSYVASESYGACSANCGGTQSRVFICADAAGAVVPSERCSGLEMPAETRLCDGNPDAVKRSESTVSTIEGGQCTKCPTNQIGVVVQEREVTTTKNYACIDHQVKQASETVSEGPWKVERYCRDYVPHRCSQDSLSNTEADQRYQWMVKCEDSVPVIKDFLQAFASYKGTTGNATNLLYNKRRVYPTFMVRAGGAQDKVWKAPVKSSAACTVPEGAYVAAVCTSSCATPEQEILGQSEKGGQLKYAPIGQAWQEQFKYVATLNNAADIHAKRVVRTPVDYWVTELIDGDHEILTFKMKSGGQLRVTPNHPILSVNGAMKLAGDWKAGESLVRLGGEADEIVSIEQSTYFGKVYNLFVTSNDLKKNVVVTGGYLNGTAYFQNDGAKYVNTQILRTNLIRGALNK